MSASLRIALLTALAMVAFAGNSVIARLALFDGAIGAWSYTLIRLLSGAIVLGAIVGRGSWAAGSWGSGGALVAYGGLFSFAYLALSAGTGALILFAVVQITMIGWGLWRGERLTGLQWAGVVVALAALGWLVSPGLEAPDPIGALAMALSGVGWGAYSLRGRGGGDPTASTAGNFLRASVLLAPLAPVLLWLAPEAPPSLHGVLLACLSGAVTSGLGYVVWYTALKGLTATRAGIAQLSVPAIAALGGVLFVAEPVTLRFALASVIILGGVGLATLTPRIAKAS